MKMSRRYLFLLLALMIFFSLISGCAGSDNSDNTKENTVVNDVTATATANAKKENFNAVGYPIVNEPITVSSVYFAYSDDVGKPEEMSYWKKLEEVTNIKIKWTRIDNQDDTQIELFYAAGEFPDFMISTVDTSRQFSFGVEGGIFVDYSDMLDEYMPNLVSWFKQFPEAEKAVRQTNGAVYTLPSIQYATTSAFGQMFYRTDYLEQLGLKTPTTIDEFYKALVAIKGAGLTGEYTPFLPNTINHLNNHAEPFLFAAFGDATEAGFSDNGSGKVVFNRTSEQYKRYLAFMNKLYNEGLLEKEVFTIDSGTANARVQAGQAAFMSSAQVLSEADFKDGKIHLDCLAPLTSEYANKQKVTGYDYINSQGGAINKNCKYVKELLRMFDINYSKDEVVPGSGLNCLSMNLGLEGVDWKYTNPEKTSYTFTPPTSWDPTKSIWGYITKYVSWGEYYGAFVSMATSGTGNNLVREQGLVKNNIPFAIPKFPVKLMKYKSEESNTITSKLTDIDSYVDLWRAQFITGVEPLSKWDEYVAQLDKMGIKEVIAAQQSAYDRWNSK